MFYATHSKSAHDPPYSSRKKLVRFARADDVDKVIFEWFQAARSNSIPINGPLTEEKALAMAKLLGPTELHASVGWLN
ncbi:Tigger transposable element-derived protein 6 [Trichinella papuae]|uniref:Tigger transposable element-derived protein 6 n=1 Tax=Trichinella papuae TaxID=268474 RepID=A0A0V1M540_9BILA|nr:Tigger transposable element-derived protein 6 [Trichinella papuae]